MRRGRRGGCESRGRKGGWGGGLKFVMLHRNRMAKNLNSVGRGRGRGGVGKGEGWGREEGATVFYTAD